ncbi:MAG: methionine--tRNA ligase [Candidatus Nomurabacteria bacterium]|nr:methionine--tRNA ligase [Candidatus Nomurabacteria bacterium]
MKKSYITTAIPYVNGVPHLGHAMDYLLADTMRRYLVRGGEEVRLQAGTDEHGSKVFQKAEASGVPVEKFVDENAKKFQDFIHALGVEYTDFVRTTDPEHERRCQEIWVKLGKYIYKDAYEGWYCEGCEGFVTEKEYEENNGVCPDHQKPYVRLSEENYYLRIADFKERMRSAIENDEMKITPAGRKKEFLNLLVDMPDVSISRPKKQLSWGVPVPGDDTQVMYVWIDALANYITVLGYPDKDISEWWPAEVQVIGKDILRFHAGIWPAILMGLNLPLPKNLLTHGYITVNGEKMSKSVGNVVDPRVVLDKYGVDAFRYYFLRHVSTMEDADYSDEKYESAYNELANDLGNLVQRLATLCVKGEMTGQTMIERQRDDKFDELMGKYEFNVAFDYVWAKVQGLNKKIDTEKPWELVKTDPEKLVMVLDSLVSEILGVADLLEVFIPETAKKIVEIFSAEKIVPPETSLFPRTR